VLRIRKLSLNEQFRLMGFVMTDEKQEIKLPGELNYNQIAARVGNGWDINVVGKLIKHIFEQL
jgi:DNA (cytosine-5)-methyltransferase 1